MIQTHEVVTDSDVVECIRGIMLVLPNGVYKTAVIERLVKTRELLKKLPLIPDTNEFDTRQNKENGK